MKDGASAGNGHGVEGVTEPKQKRSAAAFSRIKDAALALMRDPETTDFRLTDVSRIAKVSIGSIYARVDGKAELVRLLQHEELERLEGALRRIGRRAEGVEDFPAAVRALVHGYITALAEDAALLRYFMWISGADAEIRRRGSASDGIAEEIFVGALRVLCTRAAILAAPATLTWCYELTNSVIAHQLSFNTLRGEPWSASASSGRLSAQLATTITAYLHAAQETAFDAD